MSRTLVVTTSMAETLMELACHEVETAGVMFGHLVEGANGDFRLLLTELHLVPEDAYDVRRKDRLQIQSGGFVPPLRLAEESGSIPLWFHTHPGDNSSPRPSNHDRRVDSQLSTLFRMRSGSEYYGSVIVSHSGPQLTFTGHLESDAGSVQLDRLATVGSRFSVLWNADLERESLDSIFDRNVRAFGGDVQRVLNDLAVAVVGCGGTGSAVAEQLVRLGVRNLLLVDGDRLSDHNVTRVYGSTPQDVGAWKVDVLANYLKRIAPDSTIDRKRSMITTESTARALCNVDLVFGCTDDNAGRLILSRLATYMLVPVIDCGVLLSSDAHGTLDGIHGRVTLMYPGTACLLCRDRIDLARAGAEMLSPEERASRIDEGYAPALGGVEPAVVSFTTLVAATAVSELLERLTGYGPPQVPSEILLRVHDREVSTNEQSPREHHYCDPDSHKLGLGITDPLLELVWQN
jgi:molybdopterin/thiamine biosynthesis adenylyltransferase/proteasome lid subunit RPN8/RPN11